MCMFENPYTCQCPTTSWPFALLETSRHLVFRLRDFKKNTSTFLPCCVRVTNYMYFPPSYLCSASVLFAGILNWSGSGLCRSSSLPMHSVVAIADIRPNWCGGSFMALLALEKCRLQKLCPTGKHKKKPRRWRGSQPFTKVTQVCRGLCIWTHSELFFQEVGGGKVGSTSRKLKYKSPRIMQISIADFTKAYLDRVIHSLLLRIAGVKRSLPVE